MSSGYPYLGKMRWFSLAMAPVLSKQPGRKLPPSGRLAVWILQLRIKTSKPEGGVD